MSLTKLRHERKIIFHFFIVFHFSGMHFLLSGDSGKKKNSARHGTSMEKSSMWRKILVRKRKMQKRFSLSYPKKIFSSFPCNKNLILDINFLQTIELDFGRKLMLKVWVKMSERETRLQIIISHTKGKLHTANFSTFLLPVFFRENFDFC